MLHCYMNENTSHFSVEHKKIYVIFHKFYHDWSKLKQLIPNVCNYLLTQF